MDVACLPVGRGVYAILLGTVNLTTVRFMVLFI